MEAAAKMQEGAKRGTEEGFFSKLGFGGKPKAEVAAATK